MRKAAHRDKSRGPEWLQRHTQKIFSERKLVERLGQIAAGDAVDVRTKYVLGRGSVDTPCPAPMAAQVAAIRELADRAYGTPVQAVKHTGELSVDGLSRLIDRAERERGLK